MSRSRPPSNRTGTPPEPWRSFLLGLDASLSQRLELHCIGGFVVTQRFGISRATSDIDILPVLPAGQMTELRSLAGQGSELHRRHRIYIEPVTVAWPAEYRSRLERLWRALKDSGCGVLRDGVYVLPAAADPAGLARLESDIRAHGGFALTAELTPKTPAQLGDIRKLFDRSARAPAFMCSSPDPPPPASSSASSYSTSASAYAP